VNKAITLGLLLAFSVVSASAQKTAKWVKYTSVEGRYSVSMPEVPKLSQQESATAEGVKFPQYMATAGLGNGVFMVGYFDNLPDTRYVLDEAVSKMAEGLNAKVISQSSISLTGSPGRAAKLSMESDGILFINRARLYSVGTRNYFLQYIVPKADDGARVETMAAKFFNSFAVKDR